MCIEFFSCYPIFLDYLSYEKLLSSTSTISYRVSCLLRNMEDPRRYTPNASKASLTTFSGLSTSGSFCLCHSPPIKKSDTHIDQSLFFGVAQDDVLVTANLCSGLWIERDTRRLDSSTDEFGVLPASRRMALTHNVKIKK